MGTASVAELLADPEASIVVLSEVTLWDGAAETIFRAGTEAWKLDPDEDPDGIEFSPLLINGLNSAASMDGETYGGIDGEEDGILEFFNGDGSLDYIRDYSVDGRSVRILAVGKLKNGNTVRYSDAVQAPLVDGQGIKRPYRGYKDVQIRYRGGLYKLDRVMAPRLLSPPCPVFPGSSSEYINFGDNYDQTGTFTIGPFWIYAEDPITSGQIIFDKDTGIAGMVLSLGTAGSGALRFLCREQVPGNTDTATGIIQLNFWHWVAIRWTSGTVTREIIVDGTVVGSTAAVLGSPVGNSANFRIGPNFRGRISRFPIWNTARTNNELADFKKLPVLGTESGLVANIEMDEGKGDEVADTKSGSSIVGTLTSGVLWSDTTEWIGDSLVGRRWPEVIGGALDIPLLPIDPAEGYWAAARGPLVAATAIRSNHADLSGGTYTWDLARGVVNITGSVLGQLTADIISGTAWNGAVSYDGSTGYASGTVTCPTGTMSIKAVVRPTTMSAVQRNIAGWHPSGAAGVRQLGFLTTGQNVVAFFVTNDVVGTFIASVALPTLLRDYVVIGILDTSNSRIQLYVDGVLAATTATTGAFTTTVTPFTIARRSASSTLFLPGKVDDVKVWNRALSLAEAEAETVSPTGAGTSGLTQWWKCDDGPGATTLANSVGGGATLTLNATYTWRHGRILHADMLRSTLIDRCEYATSLIDVPSFASWIRDVPGDAGWYVADDQSCRDVWDKILRGAHSLTGLDSLTGLIYAESIVDDTGSHDADFDRSAYPKDRPPSPEERSTEGAYQFFVQYAQNNTPLPPDAVAGLLTTSPPRFQYAISRWRRAHAGDLAILDREPQSVPLSVESAFLNHSNALDCAERAFPFYIPNAERLWFVINAAGLSLRLNKIMRWTVVLRDGTIRLGMASPGRKFVVLKIRRSMRRRIVNEVLGWAS